MPTDKLNVKEIFKKETSTKRSEFYFALDVLGNTKNYILYDQLH
jgi:hypothetical protein